jgi:hypothetical protein
MNPACRGSSCTDLTKSQWMLFRTEQGKEEFNEGEFADKV